jgi:hypothetical protein
MVFRQHVANARFLFGPEIARFVEAVEQKALTRGDAYVAVPKAPTEDERVAATKILNGTTEWAQTEARAIKERFAPYLDLSKWR